MTNELVSAYVVYMRAAGQSEGTIEVRTEHLRRLDRELPNGLRGATPQELIGWHAAPGWAPATRSAYVDHTKGFYRWATGAGMTSDPAAGLRRPRVPSADPRPVTDDQLRAALARATGQWRLAIILAAYAGLRASEVARLEREDITSETVMVVRGKGGQTASVPCHPAVWAAVEHSPPGRLLHSYLGYPITGRWFTQQSRGYFDGLGLPGVTLHRFRHWFATTAILRGADVRTVQTLLRHTSLATTARYIRITDRQRAAAVATLPSQPASQPGGSDGR